MFPFAPTRARDQGRVARAQDLPPGTVYRVVHPSPGSGAALPVPGTVPASPRTTTPPPPRVRDPTRVSGAGAALPRTGIGAAPPVPGTLPTRVRTCRQQRVDQHRPPVHGPGHTRPPPLRSAPHRQPLSGGAAPRRVEGGGAGGGGAAPPSRPREGLPLPPRGGGLAGRSPPERGGTGGCGRGGSRRSGAAVDGGRGVISHRRSGTRPPLSPARGTQRRGAGVRGGGEPRGADYPFRAALQLWRGGDG